MEAITAQQATIEAKGQENSLKIQESITAQEKAEAQAKKMEALNLVMQIFGGIAVGIMLLAAIPSGGATLGIAVAMAASFVTMTCMTEIENENGETGMDLMGKSCAKTFYSHLPPEEAEAKGAKLANGIMIALQVVVALGCIAASCPSIVAKVADLAARLGSTATTAVSTATAAASTTTSTLATTIAPLAAKAGAALQVVQGSTGIAAGVVAMDVAEAQYDASMANAEVTRLQALVQMLQQILEGESAFVTMLMELQAQLDAFVAGEVADEHVSNEQTDLHGGAMA
jgi:hypothetical protein